MFHLSYLHVLIEPQYFGAFARWVRLAKIHIMNRSKLLRRVVLKYFRQACGVEASQLRAWRDIAACSKRFHNGGAFTTFPPMALRLPPDGQPLHLPHVFHNDPPTMKSNAFFY
jgi:hypothetical protein